MKNVWKNVRASKLFWPSTAVAAVVTIIALVLVEYHHQHPQNVIENHARQNTPEERGQIAEERIATYTLWLTVFTGALAIGTVALGFATVLLWRETKRIRQDTADSLRTLERPILHIAAPSFIGPTQKQQFHVQWVLRNAGRNPAFIEQIYSEVAYFDPSTPLPTFSSRVSVELGQIVIEAMGHRDFSTQCQIPNFSLIPVLDGLQQAMFFGTIVYDDVWKNRRQMAWCFIYSLNDRGQTEFTTIGGFDRNYDKPIERYEEPKDAKAAERQLSALLGLKDAKKP